VLYDFYKNNINRLVFVSREALFVNRRTACVKELEHQLHGNVTWQRKTSQGMGKVVRLHAVKECV